jgi:hypothetical protein
MMANSPETAKTKRQRYAQLQSALLLERSSFEQHWRDLANFVKPKRLRQFVTDRNRGDRRNQSIIDSAATFAHRTLQSGLHAGLTSPARPWFKLSTPDPELAKFRPVKTWLHDVTERMLSVFLKSNLYTALPTVYGDLGLFATAAVGILEDEKELFRCYPYPINSYALGVSRRQMVDTFIREYQLTVEQLIEEFALDRETNHIDWSVVSPTVKGLWEKGNTQQGVEVCWIVTPNPDRDDSKLDSKYYPFYSCHFEKGQEKENQFLREKGFREFPILAPRWEVAAEDIYGTDCPGMTALGDIRALQTMTKRKAQAVEKMINPPLQAPTHLINKVVSSLPGGVTHVDVQQQQQGIRPIHEVSMSIDDVRVDIEDTRQLIRRAFYEDLFLMLAMTDRREITAREIEERHEEKLLALGPMLERSNDELHEPLIDRVYPMMERAGLIPDPPAELEGVALKVEYLSLMSQAQKLVGIGGLDRFARSVMAVGEMFPHVRHKVNVFRMVEEYADALGVHPDIVVPDDEAQASLEAEQQALAQQQQAEQAQAMAKSARDLGNAPLTGDNALQRLVGA